MEHQTDQPETSPNQSSEAARKVKAQPPTTSAGAAAWSETGPSERISPQAQSSPDSTYASDWQAESLILFAQRTCQLLGDGSPAQSPNQIVLCNLIKRFMAVASGYYTRGAELLGERGQRPFGQGVLAQDPKAFERRRLIERIGEEWSFLMTLVASAQLLPESDPALAALNHIIKAATSDLVLQKPHTIAVLPHFGRHFELVKFHYAPDIVVLGIPVSSLYCTWEWPVVWHEAAAIYIESIKSLPAGPLTELMQVIAATVEDRAGAPDWAAAYQAVVGSLVAAATPPGQAPDPAEQQRFADLVLRNWSEEVMEDAIGIMCLGESMVETLGMILLERYPSPARTITLADVDPRHPPADLRLCVAIGLSFRMGTRASDTPNAGAQRVAAALAGLQAQMVRRVFTPADEYDITRIIGEIAAGTPTHIESQSPAQVAATLGAVARAARAGAIPAQKVRAYLFHDSALFAAGMQVQPDLALVETLSADNLREFAFSEADFVSADVAAHQDHNTSVTVAVSFSGITKHTRNHAGTAWWAHTH